MWASTVIKTKLNKKHKNNRLPRKAIPNTFSRTNYSQVSLRYLFHRLFSDCTSHGTALTCGLLLLYVVLCPEHNDTLHAMKRWLDKGPACLFLRNFPSTRCMQEFILYIIVLQRKVRLSRTNHNEVPHSLNIIYFVHQIIRSSHQAPLVPKACPPKGHPRPALAFYGHAY